MDTSTTKPRNELITALATDPTEDPPRWEYRWGTLARGLVTSWHAGRNMAIADTDLSDRTKRGELPILPWKGGVAPDFKGATKTGNLYYYAFWLGMRGDDLSVDPSATYTLTCALTNVTVTYKAAENQGRASAPNDEANSTAEFSLT